MNQKQYYVYIITNWNNSVFYTGVTNNLVRRIHEHKTKSTEGFSKKYNLSKLVFYEVTNDVISAITHEKRIKDARRAKKIAMIEKMNPNWQDLYEMLT